MIVIIIIIDWLKKSTYLIRVQAPFLHHIELLHSDTSRGLLCHPG